MFFAKAELSAFLGLSIWVYATLLYLEIFQEYEYLDEFEFSSNFVRSLFPGAGLGFLVLSISALEAHEGGLHFSTMFTRLHEDGISVGLVILAFILSSLIHMFLIAVVEVTFPDKSKRKPWYEIFEFAWNKILRRENTPNCIKINFMGNCAIKVNNLTKVFKRSKAVVNGVSFEVLTNEITVLLGNQTEVSEIFAMLKTLYLPTFGEITFCETYDKSFLGISAKSDEMFRDFNPLEQLLFTCKVRGLNEVYALKESRKYLELLNLISVRMTPISNLSNAEIQKLSIANALCGSPNIVFLENPTSGLDPITKKKIWNLLREEKKSKPILIGTNCATEADTLANQIILLRDGKIEESGTPAVIRKKLGVGYRLICTKSEICQTESITVCLKLFIPDIEVHDENDKCVTYILNETYLPKFSEILEILEKEGKNFGIGNLKFHETNLDDLMAR